MMDQVGLECLICLDYFKHPKMLRCGHSYCKGCLEDLLTSNGDVKFVCPECRLEVRLVASELDSLPTNVALVRAIEEARQYRSEDQVYCNTCSIMVESEIDQLDTQHDYHECVSLEEKAEEIKDKIQRMMCSLDEDTRTLGNFIEDWKSLDKLKKENTKSLRQQIIRRKEKIKQEIENYSRELLSRLQQDETEYLRLSTEAQDALTKQIQYHHLFQTEVKSLVDDMNNVVLIQNYSALEQNMESLKLEGLALKTLEGKLYSFGLPNEDIKKGLSHLFEFDEHNMSTSGDMGQNRRNSAGCIPAASNVNTVSLVVDGEFNAPCLESIVLNGNGDFLVADTSNRTIKTITKDGKFDKMAATISFIKPTCFTRVPRLPSWILVTDDTEGELAISWWNPCDGTRTPFFASRTGGVCDKPWSVTVCSQSDETAVVIADEKKPDLWLVRLEGRTKKRWPTSYGDMRHIAGHRHCDTVVANHSGETLRAYKQGYRMWSWRPEEGHVLHGLCMLETGNVLVVIDHQPETGLVGRLFNSLRGVGEQGSRVSLLSSTGVHLRVILGMKEGLVFPRAVTICDDVLAVTDKEKVLLYRHGGLRHA